MAWVVLFGAGLLEIVWALALKQADGFTRLWPSCIAVFASVASFLLLSASLRTLPVGTAYAVWVGIGVVGVSVSGIIGMGDSASPARLVCLGFIAIGIIGLRIVEA